MMTPQQAALKYPHILKFNETDGSLDIYVDHMMLSTLRLCEAKFMLQFCNNLRNKGNLGRYWNLEFGIWQHYALEMYYKHWQIYQTPPLLDKWLAASKKLWDEIKLDWYADCGIKYNEGKYKKIGGWEGASRFLVQYYAFYMNERFRVAATEVAFGRAKEVPLGSFNTLNIEVHRVNCYLTGRIDLLVDNGNKIGPVDHKHTSRFTGNESSNFNPHEGITGYIFAINRIFKDRFPEYAAQGRVCNQGWIYHMSDQDATPRFKSSPIFKTHEQLEEYRLRQLRTCQKLYDLVVNEVTPDWNAHTCHNMYFSNCEFLPIHEQPLREQNNIMNSHYVEIEPWNPFTYGNKSEEPIKSMDALENTIEVENSNVGTNAETTTINNATENRQDETQVSN